MKWIKIHVQYTGWDDETICGIWLAGVRSCAGGTGSISRTCYSVKHSSCRTAIYIISKNLQYHLYHCTITTTPQPFYGPFSGTTRVSRCQKLENFWTLCCKGKLTEADTLTIWLGATPSRLTGVQFHHLPHFFTARCPSCRPTNSVKALKAVVIVLQQNTMYSILIH